VNDVSLAVGQKLEADKSMRADLSAAELEKRGLEFFSRVYSKVTDRVQKNMALSSGGDLDQFAMLSIYGELMAEERILNAKETGLMEFIVCYVSSAAPQAKGLVVFLLCGEFLKLTWCRHMYGSRNLGNGKVEIQKAIKLSQDLAKALNVKIDTESQTFVEKVEGW